MKCCVFLVVVCLCLVVTDFVPFPLLGAPPPRNEKGGASVKNEQRQAQSKITLVHGYSVVSELKEHYGEQDVTIQKHIQKITFLMNTSCMSVN